MFPAFGWVQHRTSCLLLHDVWTPLLAGMASASVCVVVVGSWQGAAAGCTFSLLVGCGQLTYAPVDNSTYESSKQDTSSMEC